MLYEEDLVADLDRNFEKIETEKDLFIFGKILQRYLAGIWDALSEEDEGIDDEEQEDVTGETYIS